MTPTYEDVCKAFKTGWWRADADLRKIHIDNNLASLLNLSSNEYSYDELSACIILTDTGILESVLNARSVYPLTNWNLTLELKGTTYHLEIIFELPKEEPQGTVVFLNGYARVSEIRDKQLIVENPVKIGTPYCTVHNNIQTELQDNNVRLYGVCSIGIIHPWTWCIKRGRLEIMSVTNGVLRNTEIGLDDFIDAIHPEDRDDFNEKAHLIANNSLSSLTARFRSKFLSKAYRWYEISANLMECHNHDKRFRCVGILHDIDDKKRNEEALNKTDNLLKSVYDNIPVGVELYNKEGFLVDTNRKNLELFGLDKNTDISKLNLFNNPSMPASFIDTLKEGQLTETSIHYNLDKIKSYGTGIIHLLTRGTPLFNDKNEIINYLLVHFDETESVKNSNRVKDFEIFFSAIAEYAQIGYCKWDMIAKKGFALDQWFLNLGEDPRSDIDSVISNYQYLHPDDRAMMKHLIGEIYTGKRRYLKCEIRVKKGDKWSWLHHNVVVTKYAPEEGKIEAIGINIDISRYKEMEIELTETAKKAEELVRDRDIVLDNLSSGLIYINSDFVVQWVSTDVLHPIFAQENYLPGKVCYQTAYNRDTPCEDCPFASMLETGKRTTTQKEKNGFTLEVNANPVYDRNGVLKSGIVQLVDISTHKNQERKINELNNLMDAILNNIPVNIYVKDPSNDFKYLYWNEALFRIYGLKANDVVGKLDLDIFPKEMAENRVKANKEQIERNIEKIVSESVVMTANGKENIVNSAQILIRRGDELPLIMGVSWDITELKRYEEELILAKNIAEESNHIKSAFLANMSHEIRTPLNAIVGFSELMADRTIDNEDKNEYVDIIRRNSQLLLQLISDILDLSKIEAHVLKFNYDTINVNVLCGRIAMTNNIRKEAQVSIIFDATLPEYLVYTDENRLQQIIVNFVNNAIKFTHKGDISIGYSLVNDNEIEIFVKDTGVGIPKDKLASIFERFVKLDTFVQGTGLGLSICKSLVEMMDGQIGVESEEGEGTRFWFRLPYDPSLKLED